MKNWMRFVVVALAATALVTIGFACDSEKAGEKTAGHSGCSHGAVAKAEGAGGCDHAKAEGAGGCDHAKAEAAKAEGAGGCPHAKAEAAKAELGDYKDAAAGCPFHSKATESQRAALLKGEQVTLVGQVICAACDLKQAKECKSLFKTASGELYSIVRNDAFEKLSDQTMHGEKKVEVVGTSAKDAGEALILLQSYKLIG